jgi:hypothetical protein
MRAVWADHRYRMATVWLTKVAASPLVAGVLLKLVQTLAA